MTGKKSQKRETDGYPERKVTVILQKTSKRIMQSYACR